MRGLFGARVEHVLALFCPTFPPPAGRVTDARAENSNERRDDRPQSRGGPRAARASTAFPPGACPAAAPTRRASQTIGVSVNASTSVTLTELEQAAVLDVLTRWANDTSSSQLGPGLLE